jgi:hypothetical protein
MFFSTGPLLVSTITLFLMNNEHFTKQSGMQKEGTLGIGLLSQLISNNFIEKSLTQKWGKMSPCPCPSILLQNPPISDGVRHHL